MVPFGIGNKISTDLSLRYRIEQSALPQQGRDLLDSLWWFKDQQEYLRKFNVTDIMNALEDYLRKTVIADFDELSTLIM